MEQTETLTLLQQVKADLEDLISAGMDLTASLRQVKERINEVTNTGEGA